MNLTLAGEADRGPAGIPGVTQCREQQPNQHRNDGDGNQKLDEREGTETLRKSKPLQTPHPTVPTAPQTLLDSDSHTASSPQWLENRPLGFDNEAKEIGQRKAAVGVGDRPWGRNKIPIAPSAAGIAEPFCRTAGLSVPRRSNGA